MILYLGGRATSTVGRASLLSRLCQKNERRMMRREREEKPSENNSDRGKKKLSHREICILPKK
jgi:hypothetical protein